MRFLERVSFKKHWSGRLRSLRAQAVAVVLLPAGQARMPAACANCGNIPAHVQPERRGTTSEALVPYCKTCFAQLLGQETRQVAAMLASVLVVVTLLLTLPWVSPNCGRWVYLGVALVGGALPGVLVTLVRKQEGPSQSSDGRAAWWVGSGRLCCARREFADEVRLLNQAAETLSRRARPPVARPMMWLGVLLAVLVGPSAYDVLHPEVWVLNLGAPRLELFSGPTHLGWVEPTSLESPGAGLRVRIGVGAQALRVQDASGQTLTGQKVRVSAGQSYLYAPLSEGHCFWVERDDYGRSDSLHAAKARSRRLPSDRDFWALPADIDNWFSPNPEPAAAPRFSGGSLRALRHARCKDAPETVR